MVFGLILRLFRMTPHYVDSAQGGLQRYILFSNYPDIFLEKVEGKWLYSKRTVDVIPSMHRHLYPFGKDFLVNLIPGFGHKRVLGIELWQYAGILVIMLIGVILRKIFTLILERAIKKIAGTFRFEDAQLKLITRVSKPLSLLFVFLIVLALVPSLQFSVELNRYIVTGIRVLIPVFGTLFFYRLTDLVTLYFEKLAAKTESTLDDQLIPIVRKSLKGFVLVLGLLFILQSLDVNVTALLAGMSIGGLALALAAQDTLKNLFGSLMIFVDRPFQIGDWINFEGKDGTVEEVGFRSTRVRTFANSVITIPNGKIADLTVDNLGLRQYRRFKTNIGVTYDTPPHLIDEFVEGLKGIIERHRYTRKDYYEIHLNGFGDFSLNILFYVFFKVPNWSEELKARHEVMLAVISLADELGVNFAFPTETLQIETFPEKKALSPVYMDDKDTARGKVQSFLDKFETEQKREL